MSDLTLHFTLSTLRSPTQWVDAQVGEGLTNGLYKLSVAVADDPPETTFLSVGDHSVAVTNAGECLPVGEGPGIRLDRVPAKQQRDDLGCR